MGLINQGAEQFGIIGALLGALVLGIIVITGIRIGRWILEKAKKGSFTSKGSPKFLL